MMANKFYPLKAWLTAILFYFQLFSSAVFLDSPIFLSLHRSSRVNILPV
jgi:hypothetical protein